MVKRILLIILFILKMAAIISAQALVAEPKEAVAPKKVDSRKGAITGRVIGEDGQPSVGQRVNLMPMKRTPQGGNFPAMTTDEKGEFKFSNVEVGLYGVISSAPGFIAESKDSTGGVKIGDDVTLLLKRGGVITGRVTNAYGEPMVGVLVSASMSRDEEGEAVQVGGSRGAMTDDRGAYRLYGLRAGSYIVQVRDSNNFGPQNESKELSIYYPSATRDAAQEVTVQPSAEISGIDIRYRVQYGNSVSGNVVNAAADTDARAFTIVELYSASNGSPINSDNVRSGTASRGFSIPAVPDGDYELVATMQSFGNSTSRATLRSNPVKVSVKGNDISGLTLKLLPQTGFAGKVTVEKFAGDKSTCQINRTGWLEEVNLNAAKTEAAIVPLRGARMGGIVPETNGEFAFKDLSVGEFRLGWRLPTDFWYAKSLTAPGPKTAKVAAKPIDLAKTGINLGSGQYLTNVSLVLAEGAASVQGKINVEAGKSLPEKVMVYLVPTAVADAENLLRYFSFQSSDGSYNLKNLQPGSYWIVTRAKGEPAKMSLTDPVFRASLRKQGEAANNKVELQPCQQTKDFNLTFSQAR